MQPNNQNSDQPEQPTPIPAVNNSSTSRIIQPLSSEEDIRRDTDAPVEHTTVTQPQQTPMAPPDDQTMHYANTPAAPQVSPLAQATYPTAQAQPTPASVKPRKRAGKIIVISIIAVIGLLAALGFMGYTYLYGDKVKVSDLTPDTLGETAFLRPRQWQMLPSKDTVVIYSNSIRGSGKVNSFVGVGAKSLPMQNINTSDNTLALVRKILVARATVNDIQPFFEKAGMRCSDAIKFTAVPDEKKTATTTGIMTTSGTCTREDGAYTVKTRMVVGKAGSAHLIILGALDKNWTQNQEAFQAIMDSISQADNAI